MSESKPKEGVSRTVWVLSWASYFTDCSSEMIYPLLPVFLSTVLGATALQLGVIEGFAEATASFFKVVSGIWADRVQRRRAPIVVGYTISGFFRPLIGLAASWHYVLLLRFFDRVGKGIRTSPRDALIADVTHPARRGAAFGLNRMMDHAGAVTGPLLAGAILLIPGMNLQTMFLLAAVPALITFCVVFFGLKEPKHKVKLDGAPPLALIQDWNKLGPQFRMFLVSLIVFTLGNSADAFLLMKLSKAGVAASWIATLWSLHHVVKMACTYYGGQLSDVLGRKPMIVAGWFVYAMIYLGFAYIQDPTILIVVFLLYGIYFGLVEPSEKALISDLVPSQLRGTAFGYYHFTIGVGALPASVVFGLVWEKFGAHSAFLMGAMLAVGASIVLALIPTRPGAQTATG